MTMQIYLASLITFVSAFGIVYLDAYQALRAAVFRVPALFWRSFALGAFATFCGMIAVVAFLFASFSAPSFTWLSNILGSQIDNIYIRALFTGLAVTAIVRSKIFQIRGVDVGVEYFYSELRAQTLGYILADWTEYRNSFIREHLDKFFALPNAAEDLRDLIEANVEFSDPKYKDSIGSQLDEAFRNRPGTPISSGDSNWRLFYRTLLNLALSNCGPEALRRRIS